MNRLHSELRTIEGHTYCSLMIGEVSGEIPRHLLTGEQECGYIYRDGNLTELYYSRIIDIDGTRSILYDTPLLIPVTEIGRHFPHELTQKLLELSSAVQAAPRTFFENERGLIPSWRLYLLEQGGVVMLSERVSDLIFYSASTEDRNEHVHRYYRKDLYAPFALCHQFTQLLYLALADFAPFEAEEVKQTSYQPIPFQIATGCRDETASAMIDSILTMRISDQRASVSGAYSASENLSWFDEKIRDLTFTRVDNSVKREQLETYRAVLKRKAQRREFWRKKGIALLVGAAALLIVISVSVQAILRSNAPPATAGMSPQEVIQDFFAAQNALDIERMNESLARGVKNPFEQEVTTLFVNSRVRQAYEQFDAHITPDELKASERGTIPDTAILYGVDELQIFRDSEDSYIAEYLLYMPHVPQASEESSEGNGVFAAAVVQSSMRFTVREDRGYVEITGIEQLEHDVIETLSIPYER